MTLVYAAKLGIKIWCTNIEVEIINGSTLKKF